MITPLGGVTPTKPGSASLPFFGIEPAIIDPVSGEEIQGNDVEGVLAFKQAWPSMARTVWGAHKRYMDTYLNVYKGYYFTGDGAARDYEGYYWIRGRVDDVVNVDEEMAGGFLPPEDAPLQAADDQQDTMDYDETIMAEADLGGGFVVEESEDRGEGSATILNAEVKRLTMYQARAVGLSEEWIRHFENEDPEQLQLLMDSDHDGLLDWTRIGLTHNSSPSLTWTRVDFTGLRLFCDGWCGYICESRRHW